MTWIKGTRDIDKWNLKQTKWMEVRTHTSLHLPLHFWCVSIADEYPTILFWPQMAHYLLLVQLFYLSRFQCDVCTGMDTGPRTSQYHVRRSPQKGRYRWQHPFLPSSHLLSSLWFFACCQASRFVLDLSLQASSPKRYNKHWLVFSLTELNNCHSTFF